MRCGDEFNFTRDNKCTDLKIGYDFSWTLVYKINEVAEDITGYVFSGKIYAPDGTLFLDITEQADATTSGIYKVDPTNGRLIFTITDTDSANMVEGNYTYHIDAEYSGNSEVFMMGLIQTIEV